MRDKTSLNCAAERFGGAAAWVVVVVTGLLFIALAATGALLSGEKPAATAVKRFHRIAPYLTLISSAATLNLLLAW